MKPDARAREQVGPTVAAPFSFRAGADTSDRFAALAWGRPLDVDALGSRVLALPPGSPGETPCVGVIAEVVIRRTPSLVARPIPTNPLAAATALREALTRTVDRLLEGVGRVAVLTGGGVDSSALLALAVERARRVGGSAFGVALDFAGPGDDRPFRKSLAAHLECEVLVVRPAEAAHRRDLFERGIDAVPLTWPGGPMEVELLARARAHGAECALMGVAADELLDGDPRSLADLARDGSPRRAVLEARAIVGFGPSRAPAASWVVRPLLARAVPVSLRRWRAKRAPLQSPEWARPRLRRRLVTSTSVAIEEALDPPRDALERLRRFEHSRHHVHLQWLRHQEQVASGLERRDPYLDPELARFVMSLPPRWLLHGGARRGLFREAMRGLLPEDIRLRTSKASFEPAFASYVEASGGFASLASLASMRELATIDLVDPRAFRDAFAAFAHAPSHGWEDIWPALAVETFLRHRGAS